MTVHFFLRHEKSDFERADDEFRRVKDCLSLNVRRIRPRNSKRCTSVLLCEGGEEEDEKEKEKEVDKYVIAPSLLPTKTSPISFSMNQVECRRASK